MTFEQKVHDTIMAILATASVPVVTFERSDGSAFVAMTVDEDTTVLAQEAEASPTQYKMRPATSKLVGAYVDEIDFVTWQAFVQFETRVAPETFIQGFSRTVAAEGDQRLFDLRLTDVNVEHPPRNRPGNGTFVSMTIEVHPAPA